MERQLLKNEVFALNSKKILEDNKLDSQSFSSVFLYNLCLRVLALSSLRKLGC